jgi:hypothetical protein
MCQIYVGFNLFSFGAPWNERTPGICCVLYWDMWLALASKRKHTRASTEHGARRRVSTTTRRCCEPVVLSTAHVRANPGSRGVHSARCPLSLSHARALGALHIAPASPIRFYPVPCRCVCVCSRVRQAPRLAPIDYIDCSATAFSAAGSIPLSGLLPCHGPRHWVWSVKT